MRSKAAGSGRGASPSLALGNKASLKPIPDGAGTQGFPLCVEQDPMVMPPARVAAVVEPCTEPRGHHSYSDLAAQQGSATLSPGK